MNHLPGFSGHFVLPVFAQPVRNGKESARDVFKGPVNHAARPNGFARKDACIDGCLGIITNKCTDKLHPCLDFAACVIKVIIWEHSYYANKEGTKREPAIEIGVTVDDEPQEVDETDITPQQIIEHTVAPDKPRYLMAAFMGAETKARVREIGLTSSGALGTLSSIFDVGWYRDSSKPGQNGTIVMDGHNGGPTKSGIFKHLDLIQEGDRITIERGDGSIFHYETKDVKILPLAEAQDYMSEMFVSPVLGKESLSLISCTGEWSQARRTYLSRVMVRAVRIDD